MKGRSVVISGGGTGGHLYPSLAVGEKLRSREPSLRLTFIGGHRAMEKSLMERQGVHFIPMRIEGLKGRGLKSLRTMAMLPFAFARSLAILLRLRPALVIGVGGYSSGPVVLAGSLLGIPTLILEQNLTPGFTNRLLTRWATKAVVAFESSLRYFKGKGVWLGNPVREEFYRIGPKPRTPKLDLLVFGGSQGARVLNRTMAAALPLLAPARPRLRITHQTGTADSETVRTAYAESGFADAEVSPFFHDMASRFETADLVVGRAGATTIAELIVARRAAILVPFAAAADNHQAKNAGELARIGAAEVILESDLSPALLAGRIMFYLEHRERLAEMADSLDPLRTERPADRIAELCFTLMEAGN
jgi:UDP-N-acetylglucosamine--N-acetylmuramyl-(pentapeptide) pyrophosphoryl-undecaprenol N-acetylglucosamine transferase